MPEMLDPGLEHLHRHGRLWRLSTERRRLIRELQLDLLLLVPVVALIVLAPGGSWAGWLQVALLVAGCTVASLVRFDIGSGSTSPMIVAQVPLWYAVPPGWIPVFVGLAFMLGSLFERAFTKERRPLWPSLLAAGDAWPTVGPAAALALAGSPEASVDGFWVFLLAFAAHSLVDIGFGIANPWFVHGVRPSVSMKLMAWIVAVDGALAPVGFLAAIATDDQPLLLIALLPLVAVLGEFARERRDRLDQAVQLSAAYRGTAQLMGDVLEADDAYTGGEHTQGVVDLAIAVGLELRLSPRQMRDVEFGALLHDVGKLRVPNEIINKTGPLDDGEWEIVRQHPVFGQEMLDRVGGALGEAGRIVRAHHERWDGSGYPDGLRAEEIPIAARIVTVCDSFSAMTTTRSYRAARSVDDALVELERCAGTQFDPDVVHALQRVLIGDPELAAPLMDRVPAAARAIGLRPLA